MNPLMVITAALLVVVCSPGCSPNGPNGQAGSFEIYFLKDTSITEYQARQIDVNRVELRDDPWLAEDDIQFYDFSSHCIYLKGDKSAFFEQYDSSHKYYPFIVKSRPFVVVANKSRCYVGYLHSAILSIAPAGPYMDDLDVGMYPADVMHISKAWTSGTDLRNDTRIKDALSSAGLFHAGISVSLRSVNILENSDTSTVEYVLTITNLDDDNLFVIDPNKMGTELFHYFTNGVVFQGNGVLYQSLYKRTASPTVSWDPAWYTKVPANGSIDRTVRLRGYPRIAPGNYSCSLVFADPRDVLKESRSLSDGRIWLGELESTGIEVAVQ